MPVWADILVRCRESLVLGAPSVGLTHAGHLLPVAKVDFRLGLTGDGGAPMLAEMTEMLGPMAKPLKLAFIGFCIAALVLLCQ